MVFPTRCEKSLQRITELTGDFLTALARCRKNERISGWGAFARAAFLAENRRLSYAATGQQLSSVLAVRVTENAGGNRASTTSARMRPITARCGVPRVRGVIIAQMAFLKIQAGTLGAPLLIEAFPFSMIYGLGFVLIYLLDFTV